MKFLAIIPAFVVLLLSFKPATASFLAHEEQEEVCCEPSCTDDECQPSPGHEEEKKDDCCDNNCNPVDCCCFHAFFSPVTPLIFTAVTDVPADRRIPLYTSFLSSQHIVDFWQPPRFV